MKLSPQANKGHLVVGAILVLLSLGAFIAAFFFPHGFVSFLIFFFGVWGGIETGRYLESFLTRQIDREER